MTATSGQVEAYDAATGTSLMGATVVMRNTVTGATYSGTTDSDPNQYPHYWVTPLVDEGTYTFTVSKIGYQAFMETDSVGGVGWSISFPLTADGGDGGGGTSDMGRAAITAIGVFAALTIMGDDSPKKVHRKKKGG